MLYRHWWLIAYNSGLVRNVPNFTVFHLIIFKMLPSNPKNIFWINQINHAVILRPTLCSNKMVAIANLWLEQEYNQANIISPLQFRYGRSLLPNWHYTCSHQSPCRWWAHKMARCQGWVSVTLIWAACICLYLSWGVYRIILCLSSPLISVHQA